MYNNILKNPYNDNKNNINDNKLTDVKNIID